MSILDNKLITRSKIDSNTSVRVFRNDALARVIVEFNSDSPRLTLQKSFQDTHAGWKEAENFQATIQSTEDLKNYLGFNKYV